MFCIVYLFIDQQYQWIKEKLDHSLEEAYHAYKKGDKEKLKSWTQEVIVLEKQCAAFDVLVPLVKSVQKNVKVLMKSDECPDDFKTAVASIIYFASVYGMPSFERFKQQILYRYGEKYVTRICTKHKDVDDEIFSCLNYKPSKEEIKDRSKDLQSLSKKRAKEETKMIAESNEVLKTSIRDIPSTIVTAATAATATAATAATAKKGKKGKKGKKVESESDEEYSDYSDSAYSDSSDSEDEKKKKKNAKKDKKDKKDKKEVSKKTKKTKKEVDSDSDSDDDTDDDEVPVAAQPKQEQPKQEQPKQTEQPEVATEEVATEEIAHEEVAKEEIKTTVAQ